MSDFLFNRYAQNWNLIKQHPQVKIGGIVDEVFICPMCFQPFGRELLTKLRPEHIPPSKLGGQVRTLTCEECNHWAGSILESKLSKMLNTQDFLNGVPGSSYKGNYAINGGGKLQATAYRRDLNNWELIGYPPKIKDLAHRKRLDEFLNTINPEDITISFQFRLYNNQHAVNAALLRIAYLWAFSVFGYGFVLNRNLPVVRTQIKHPEENILPDWGITSLASTDIPPGVRLVIEPKELQSFLVVFQTMTPQGTKTTYGIMLPKDGYPGGRIYSWLGCYRDQPIPLRTLYIPENEMYFTKYPFLPLDIWKHLHEIIEE